MAVAVTGLADVQRALAKAEKEIRLGVRKELRDVAEPVRATAERNALEGITNIGPVPRPRPQWHQMRIGVTRNLVYVAPKQRGVRWNKANPGRGFNKRRPNLADLLMDRAMEPALRTHEPHFERDIEMMLDRVCVMFNRAGV